MSSTAIADHAFLSDCHSCALVTREGSVDWLAFPRFDSDPVLGRLLDDSAGHFLLRPDDESARPSWRYLDQTLVLETTWACATGVVVVRDAMAMGGRERGHDLGLGAPGVLLRQARCVSGSVTMSAEWAPRPEFGLVHPRLVRDAGGVRSEGGSTVLLLSTEQAMEIAGATATACVELVAGQEFSMAVGQSGGWDEPPARWSRRQIGRRLEATQKAWCSWSDLHQNYEGPLRDLVHHSGRVLQGLTYARTGAIIAAATTSLPEGVGTARTWDYRYTWVRDASMTLRGLWVAACPDEAYRFFAFLTRAAATQLDRGLNLQIMFGVGGERDLSEHELPHLSGWRDSAPVRVGNGAWNQHQQDVYGALLDAAYWLREQLGAPAEPVRVFLVAAVEAAISRWTTPDQGIWEIRGPARRYLHSALMCWVALDRGVKMIDQLAAGHCEQRWREARDQIRSAILDEGFNEELGAFTQTLGGDDLDASTLLVALVGILPGDDPRLASTIKAIAAGLSDDRGLLFRYRSDDGLDGDEGSFLICTFWLAEALAITGDAAAAAEVLNRAAGYANDIGLLPEQVEGATGQLLGNFPQAFSHLGLVLAAQAVADAQAAAGKTGG